MSSVKTVYFADYPSRGRTRSGLTVPFPDTEVELFSRVAPLSSLSMRQLLGFDSFLQLEGAAHSAGRPVATYARELLTRSIGGRLSTPPGMTEHSLQATFRGGRGSPLHDWYPYLEGYSPAFVQGIVRRYAPSANTILDPFCGSGTTALVVASMDRVGLFAEVNPVCRFVTETKARALSLNEAERDATIAALRTTGAALSTAIARYLPDPALRQRLTATLGKRPVFDPASLDAVLRLRTLLNHAEAKTPLIAHFITVAVLRSLVSSSLMVRRGDLRFRTTDELAGFRPDLIGEVRRSVELIASDLGDVRAMPGEVRFVCDDARQIKEHILEPVDAVITSPPYLNGTNYFRNTKIELCFLGYLAQQSDLRRFRDAAITAGINDVTVGKTLGGTDAFALPKRLRQTLDQLSASAYDVRIPAMVQSYFQEMGAVLSGLGDVVRPSGTVAIDLGDSCYGGVHVATDAILADIMEQRGFELVERVVLRERQSRDGRPLAQTLQVFERRPRRDALPVLVPLKPNRWEASWRSFKTDLPHQRGEMAKRNWGHPWHSLCSYQGKLKPSIASTLVAALLSGQGRFLDPFAGVGTLPFEARLQGHQAFGFDISPAAIVISQAKLGDPSAVQVAATMKKLANWVRQPRHRVIDAAALDAIRFNGPLRDYFNERTLSEIVAARSFFRENPPASADDSLVMACLLHILHGNRPYALSRRSHPITPFAPTGPAEYRPLMERLETKLGRALEHASKRGLSDGSAFSQDATKEWPGEVRDLDAIITSPPFFDSTRFHTANWMRLWFAGWERGDFERKPAEFVDERQKRSFAVYEGVFGQARERLRPGGLMAVHLGKSKKCDMAAELSVVGAKHLNLEDSFAECVGHCESHGIRDKGTVTHHQYLLFRRP